MDYRDEFLTELGELLIKHNVSIEYYPRWDDGLHLVFGDELLRMVGKL